MVEGGAIASDFLSKMSLMIGSPLFPQFEAVFALRIDLISESVQVLERGDSCHV